MIDDNKITKRPVLDINADPYEDPELPFSGGGSAAFQNDHLAAEAASEKKREATRKRSDLLPVAKDIMEKINVERAATTDMRVFMKTLGPKPTAKAISEEYRARELYIGFLTEFEIWMVNRLQRSPAGRRNGSS